MSGRLLPDDNSNPASISPSHQLTADILLIDELVSIYTRMRETMRTNELPSRFSNTSELPGRPIEDLGNTDTLANTLGNSIAATEIAQRGVQSDPGHLLLDKIPSSVMTHLRILSETASSYVAIGGMRNSGANTPAFEFSEIARHQLLQLFAGHPQISGDEPENVARLRLPSALSQDSFVFLTECSVSLIQAFNLDIHHIIRLCYLLEIVKVALYLMSFPEAFEIWRVRVNPYSESEECRESLQALSSFLMRLRHFSNPPWPIKTYQESPESPAIPIYQSPDFLLPFYKALSTYALTFVRKAAILLNVRYGVDYPDTGFNDMDDPEAERLTKALNLPSLCAMLAPPGGPATGALTVQDSVIAGWVQHWQWHQGHQGVMRDDPSKPDNMPQEVLRQSAYTSLKPQHPAIFELIGLPKQFDTLIYEVTKRHCPTTGNRLEDAALCLFCGDMFCSQASCCNKGGKGGCNQHMQK